MDIEVGGPKTGFTMQGDVISQYEVTFIGSSLTQWRKSVANDASALIASVTMLGDMVEDDILVSNVMVMWELTTNKNVSATLDEVNMTDLEDGEFYCEGIIESDDL